MKLNNNLYYLVAVLAIVFIFFPSCNKEQMRLTSDTESNALLPNGFLDVTGYFNVYGEVTSNSDRVPIAVYLVTYDAQFNKLKAYKKYSNDGQKIGDVEWDGVYNRATINVQRYFVNGSTNAVLDIISKDEMTINNNFFSEQILMVRRIANSY